MADTATPAEVPQDVRTEVKETPEAKPESEKTTTEPEVAQTEPETAKTEVTEPEPAKVEVTEPEPAKTEVSQAEPAKTEVTQAEPEATKTEPETTTALTYAQMPKPKYNPRHAHHVRNPKSYASMLIADQEMMLANLRNVRRELDREDRQLKIMQQTLYNWDYPRKWTPSNSGKEKMANLGGGYALIAISRRSEF